MKRTIEVEIEVPDDTAYAHAVAAIVQAAQQTGSVQDLRFTRSNAAITRRLAQAAPGLDWKQYSGSVHTRP